MSHRRDYGNTGCWGSTVLLAVTAAAWVTLAVAAPVPAAWLATFVLAGTKSRRGGPPCRLSDSTPAPERTDAARKGKASDAGPPPGAGADVTTGAGAVGKVDPDPVVATGGVVRSPDGTRIPRGGTGLPSP